MEFYRIEYMIMNYEEFMEEEQKQAKKNEKDQQMSFKNSGGSKSMTPPKLQIPKLNIPKL